MRCAKSLGIIRTTLFIQSALNFFETMKAIKLLLLCSVFVLIEKSYGQSTYLVNYKQVIAERKFSFPLSSYHDKALKKIGFNFKSVAQLLFNDTLAISHYYIDSFRIKGVAVYVSKTRQVGVHHSMIYNMNTGIGYEGVQRRDTVMLMYPFPMAKTNFVIDSSVVYYHLGFECYLAIANYEGKKYMALVAPQFKVPYGPALYFTTPYLCLQFFDAKYDRLYVATEVNEIPDKLFFPNILPRERYDKQLSWYSF